jgi:uncharacterized protein
MDDESVIERTQAWITSMVIGLNLCPFAKRVFDEGKIRYTVTNVTSDIALLEILTNEIEVLCRSPITDIETTLLIHPKALPNFLDYNDFLSVVDEQIEDMGSRGVVQVASFHPEYRFAGTQENSAENYTNRSPYPMLHLLREESVTKVAANPEELLQIPQRNIELLRAMGIAKIRERLT